MADKTIGELARATQIQSQDLFVLEQSGTAKSMTGQTFVNWLTDYADGHGGVQDFELVSTSGRNKTYQFTMADETTFQFVVADGATGATGAQTYVHIKWAAQEPTADNQLSNNPDAWIGIYSGTSSTAPTTRTSYAWYEYKGDKGDTGDSIDSIEEEEEGGPGQYNVYKVILDSGVVAGTFHVKNGTDGQGAPGVNNPIMDGVAAVGTSTSFAREDHVHPSDTSRAAESTHKEQTYTSVTQLGLASPATIAGAWSALPDEAILLAPASDFSSAQLPSTYGTVEMVRRASSRGWVEFHGVGTTGDYTQHLDTTTSPYHPDGNWWRMGMFTYFDVSMSPSNVAAGGRVYENISSLVPTGYIPMCAAPYLDGTQTGDASYFTGSCNSFYVYAFNNSTSARTATFKMRVYCAKP